MCEPISTKLKYERTQIAAKSYPILRQAMKFSNLKIIMSVMITAFVVQLVMRNIWL